MTNGSNFPGLWRQIIASISAGNLPVHLNTITSNDIHAVLNHYGVEAARATLIREISEVFGAYNIQVDGRHLELIADYMVRISSCYLDTGLT